MFKKKDDHNIPKDYDKTVGKDSKPTEQVSLVGGSETKSTIRVNKKIKFIAVLVVVVLSLVAGGYVIYKNNPGGVFDGINNSQEEKIDEPLTEGELTQKIVELEGQAKDSAGYEKLGLLYLEKGDYNLAIDNLNAALDNNEISDEKNVYSALAVAYYYNKQNDLAIKSYERLIELNTNSNMTGYDQAKVDDYKESINRLKQGLEL